jgi:cyclohexyl-isocyanide hydratase
MMAPEKNLGGHRSREIGLPARRRAAKLGSQRPQEMAMSEMTAGFVVFPGYTGLDLVGPHEVLVRTSLRCFLIAASTEPVASDKGLRIVPDVDFAHAPALDILVVPGGPGQTGAMADPALVGFITERAARARWVLGVCTGALLLAQAGVLRGRPATTHWLAMDALARLGAEPTQQRTVWSDNVLTGAGVSSGIDAAIELVARVFGRDEAERVTLQIEYDPQPPFPSGHPGRARPELVEQLRRTSRFHRKE